VLVNVGLEGFFFVVKLRTFRPGFSSPIRKRKNTGVFPFPLAGSWPPRFGGSRSAIPSTYRKELPCLSSLSRSSQGRQKPGFFLNLPQVFFSPDADVLGADPATLCKGLLLMPDCPKLLLLWATTPFWVWLEFFSTLSAVTSD